jgi:polyphosphate glucokinase
MTTVSVSGGSMNVFGIDIGGSGIKGAPVDTQSGELLEERVRIKTPKPATPEAIVRTAVEVVRAAGWEGAVGCGFPAVVKDGVVQTAANIDKAAIGFDLGKALRREIDAPVSLVNDADAAGLAEVRWGAGRDESGVVLMLTTGYWNRHLPLRRRPAGTEHGVRTHRGQGQGRRAPRRGQRPQA